MKAQQHVDTLLGRKAKDKVTGFSGVIASICFDLYGCIQAGLTPPVDDKGMINETKWFDISRLDVIDTTPVMVLPNFTEGYVAEGKQGSSDKPQGRY